MHIVSTRERLDRKRGGFYAKYTLPIDGLALRHRDTRVSFENTSRQRKRYPVCRIFK